MLPRIASRAAVRAALAAKGLTAWPVCPICSQQVPAATFSDLGVCTACTTILNDLEAEALARLRAAQRHQQLAELARDIALAPLTVLIALAGRPCQTWAEEQADAVLGAAHGDLFPPAETLVHPEYPQDAMVWDEEDL